MTEAEWLTGSDYAGMLRLVCGGWWSRAARWLVSPGRARRLERKMRLFLCACYRQEEYPDVIVGPAIEVAERMADGREGGKEYHEARATLAKEIWECGDWCSPSLRTADRAFNGPLLDPDEIEHATGPLFDPRYQPHSILREVIGNPYRPAVLSAECRTPTAFSLAWAAYEERELPSGHLDKARLGVLSDALEEAGCTDAEILTHLRSPGPHVRGCWALDLVMDKG